jgi:cytochrome c oxidase cbb3-type subunit III
VSASFSIFVAVLVLANVAGALWLLFALQRRKAGESTETTHTWDGDLTEFNNPLPRWWLGLFYLTVVFAAAYLIAYPGFGAFRGVLDWSQEKQLATQTVELDRLQQARLAQFAGIDFDALQKNPAAMSMAKNIYLNTCSGCHGSDARGAKGFPNLVDGDWLYGGDPQTIITTVSQGRVGVMPAWGEVLGHDGLEQVIAYVLSLGGGSVDASAAAAGRERYQQLCVACHGADGRGNQQLGSANLTDDIWLYGNTPEALRETIGHGHTATMPAHEALLGPARIRLVAAYLKSRAGQ